MNQENQNENENQNLEEINAPNEEQNTPDYDQDDKPFTEKGEDRQKEQAEDKAQHYFKGE